MPYDYESDAANVKDNLNCVHIGSDIVFLPEIDSTNNLAKEHARNNAQEGLVSSPSLKLEEGDEWEDSGIHLRKQEFICQSY
jgi:hypothetical protein